MRCYQPQILQFHPHSKTIMNQCKSFKKINAVIVLANLMNGDGSLNLESELRAKKAVETYNQLNAQFLVTCGWNYRNDQNLTIAEAFKNYITSNSSIPPNNILMETLSKDTVGDAYFTKVRLAIPKKWVDICVVTSNYHMERTREIFNMIYGENYKIDFVGTDVPNNTKMLESELISLNAFRSTFLGVARGDDVEILSRLKKNHPYYNGEIHNPI